MSTTIKPHSADLHPISRAEADADISAIEALVDELASKLKWAKEHGYPIGQALDLIDGIEDQLLYLGGAISGLTLTETDI